MHGVAPRPPGPGVAGGMLPANHAARPGRPAMRRLEAKGSSDGIFEHAIKFI